MFFWMRKDMLAKCFCKWHWNASALRRLRELVCRLRHVVALKAFRCWSLRLLALRNITLFLWRQAEARAERAFLVWCENVAERRRDRQRLASSRLWKARRRSRSC